MSDQFIGEIRAIAFSYAPRGWALCQGQTLSISSNQSLYSILGTKYGGDGTTTFGLPDFRGRTPIHPSQPVNGAQGGAESTTLTADNLPAHTHNISATTNPANAATPQDNLPANSGGGRVPVVGYGANPSDPANLKEMQPTASTGGNAPVSNRQPYEGINYIIALTGVFPPRN